jgi:hypothetical protein
MTVRVQVSISDRRSEELIALADMRGVQAGALARLLLSDQIEAEVKKVKQTDATWGKEFSEIALRYSVK